MSLNGYGDDGSGSNCSGGDCGNDVSQLYRYRNRHRPLSAQQHQYRPYYDDNGLMIGGSAMQRSGSGGSLYQYDTYGRGTDATSGSMVDGALLEAAALFYPAAAMGGDGGSASGSASLYATDLSCQAATSAALAVQQRQQHGYATSFLSYGPGGKATYCYMPTAGHASSSAATKAPSSTSALGDPLAYYRGLSGSAKTAAVTPASMPLSASSEHLLAYPASVISHPSPIASQTSSLQISNCIGTGHLHNDESSDTAGMVGEQHMQLMRSTTVTISELSSKPLNGIEIQGIVTNRVNEVITRYLPCVTFLVSCQQELRHGLAASKRQRGRISSKQVRENV